MKTNGFTLIELIVVIVILGILAASAIPAFVNLGREARIASISAVSGALGSTAALVHGKYLVTSPAPAVISYEGVNVTINNGYPKADVELAKAAGINAVDYNIQFPMSGMLLASPVSAPNPLTCRVIYNEATAVLPPTVTIDPSGC